MQSMEGVEMRIVGKLVFIGLRVLQSKGMWLCMVWLTERRNIYRYPAPSPLSTWEGLPLDWRHTTVDTFSSKKCASDFCSSTASRGLLNYSRACRVSSAPKPCVTIFTTVTTINGCPFFHREHVCTIPLHLSAFNRVQSNSVEHCRTKRV